MRNKLITFAWLAVSLSAPSLQAADADPMARVRSFTMPNGLKVVLAPSDQAKTVQIRVQVRAGHYNEDSDKAGTAHLLEHYLFTDAKLDKSMTFLDAIHEKGGAGNAETHSDQTVYYAKVPGEKAPWLIETFGKILFGKVFDEERVQHAKKPVFLEIGRPGPADFLSDLIQKLTPEFMTIPDFWQTEFGMRFPRYRVAAYRLQTEGLKAGDLESFYKRFYHPENITIFLGGRFAEAEAERDIRAAFGKEPSRPGGGWKDPQPKIVRTGTYFRSESTSDTPYIEIGTKVAALTPSEEMAARIYMGFLSHRLMKDLRNKQGETYTVRQLIDLKSGYGKVALLFESSPEKYRANLNQVRDLFEKEIREGQLTQAQFDEAKQLYKKNFELSDRDNGTMLGFAERWNRIEIAAKEAGTKPLTDYTVFTQLDAPTFKAHLKNMFKREQRLEKLTEPPLTFRYEFNLILLFSVIAWMRLGRKFVARPFVHREIRWVRKLGYPPAYLLQIGTASFTCLLTAFAFIVIHLASNRAGLAQSHFIISDYLMGFIFVGVMALCGQIGFGLVPRKLMVVNDQLWIKSLGYQSRTISLTAVTRVDAMSPLQILLTPRLAWSVKHRFYYFDPCIWRSGLLLRLENGQNEFIGVRGAHEAQLELTRFVNEAKDLARGRSQTVDALVAA